MGFVAESSLVVRILTQVGSAPTSLRLSPDSWRFTFAEELDVDDVGVAANGTIFDVLLFGPAGRVKRDDDLFAAGGAGVRSFVCGSSTFLFSFFHARHRRCPRQLTKHPLEERKKKAHSLLKTMSQIDGPETIRTSDLVLIRDAL